MTKWGICFGLSVFMACIFLTGFTALLVTVSGVGFFWSWVNTELKK